MYRFWAHQTFFWTAGQIRTDSVLTGWVTHGSRARDFEPIPFFVFFKKWPNNRFRVYLPLFDRHCTLFFCWKANSTCRLAKCMRQLSQFFRWLYSFKQFISLYLSVLSQWFFLVICHYEMTDIKKLFRYLFSAPDIPEYSNSDTLTSVLDIKVWHRHSKSSLWHTGGLELLAKIFFQKYFPMGFGAPSKRNMSLDQ